MGQLYRRRRGWVTRATLTLATMDRPVGLGWGAARRLGRGNPSGSQPVRPATRERAYAMSAWLVAAMLLVRADRRGPATRYVASYVDARHGSDANRGTRRSPRGLAREGVERAVRLAPLPPRGPGLHRDAHRLRRAPRGLRLRRGPPADHRGGQVRGRGGPGDDVVVRDLLIRRNVAGVWTRASAERTVVEHNLIIDNNRMTERPAGVATTPVLSAP